MTDKHMDEVMREHDERYERFIADKDDLRITFRFRQDNIRKACRSYARKVVYDAMIHSNGNPMVEEILEPVIDRLTDKELTKGSANKMLNSDKLAHKEPQ